MIGSYILYYVVLHQKYIQTGQRDVICSVFHNVFKTVYVLKYITTTQTITRCIWEYI